MTRTSRVLIAIGMLMSIAVVFVPVAAIGQHDRDRGEHDGHGADHREESGTELALEVYDVVRNMSD